MLLVFLVLSVLIIVSLVLVLGIAVGIGWLLTLLLPFTLFEGTVLGMLASVIVGTIGLDILRSVPTLAPPYEFSEEEEYFEDRDIPSTRFYRTEEDRTWEAWLRYLMANDIYEEFQAAPKRVAPLEDKQVQELAIRVADIALSIIKAKTGRTKRLTISKNRLKQEMTKMGQRPYDDSILNVAVGAINLTLDYYYDDISYVIQNKLWNKPAT